MSSTSSDPWVTGTNWSSATATFQQVRATPPRVSAFLAFVLARERHSRLTSPSWRSRNRHPHDDGQAHNPGGVPPRSFGGDMQRPTTGFFRANAGHVHGAAGGRRVAARRGRGGIRSEMCDRNALRSRYEGRTYRAIFVLRGGEGLLRRDTDHGEATVRKCHPRERMRRSRWERFEAVTACVTGMLIAAHPSDEITSAQRIRARKIHEREHGQHRHHSQYRH